MSFTVNDALKTGHLREAFVRAGAEGLTRPVTSINVMEVPDIGAWVKPHELLLTTLYPLRDTPDALDAFVLELAQRELAGIVVKTGRYFESIPAEMCRAAEQARLPLIELRSEVSFDEVITELLSKILSVQTRRLQHSEEVHRRFTAIVLTGGGLQHIAENLAQLVGNPIAIVAPDRRVLAQTALDPGARQALDSCMATEAGQSYLNLETTGGQPYGSSTITRLRTRVTSEEQRLSSFACPIRVGEHKFGSILLLEVHHPFDEDDAVTLEHAATVCALAITKEQAILAVERKFQSDFLDDLLAGRITSMDVVLSRSQTLGWNLARPCVVCVAEERNGSEQPAPHWQTAYLPDEAGMLLLESARATARHIDPHAIVVEKSGQLMFIMETMHDTTKTGTQQRKFSSDVEMGQHLLRSLRFLQRGREFLLGVGRPCDNTLHLHQSYQQARQAALVGRQLQGAGNVIHFNDLGFQRILSQFENRAELHTFADELLNQLETYDQHHNANLLLTLEMLLNNNLNMASTARSLHLHYNSLRYRLEKIEELTGPFMEDAHQRMNLELALQIRRIGRRIS